MLMHRVVLVPPANGLLDNPFPAASADPGHFLSGGDRFWWTCQWKVVPDQESEYTLEWKSWESQNPNPSTVFGSCYPHAFEHGFSNMRPSTGCRTLRRDFLFTIRRCSGAASTHQRDCGRSCSEILLQWNHVAVAVKHLQWYNWVWTRSHRCSDHNTHTHVRSTLESDSNIREFLLLMLRLYTQKLLSNYGEGLGHNANWAIYWCWLDEQLTDAIWVWVSHMDTNQWAHFNTLGGSILCDVHQALHSR